MNINDNGIVTYMSDELADILYLHPDVDLSKFYVEDPYKYNSTVETLYVDMPKLRVYNLGGMDIKTLDEYNQSKWEMPDNYKELDIAKYVLDLCKTESELQRVGEELLLYQERNLFDLLRWLVYFVDTLRANNIVWGVGRGSSVASYVLYLIGVHKINSMYYDLQIEEFLK